MEGITIGQIAVAVALLAGLVSGAGILGKAVNKGLKKSIRSELEPLEKKVDDLSSRIGEVDLQGTKNFLVSFLSDLETGQDPTEIELARFWEEWQHYEKIGGNSYIKRKVEQLEHDGKL